MLSFTRHPKFEKDAERLAGRSSDFESALKNFEKLCQVQFRSQRPQQVISPGKLHRLFDGGVYSIWKIELAVRNLRSNQSPRIWFALRGEDVVYLCGAGHSDNYDDETVTNRAKEYVQEYF